MIKRHPPDKRLVALSDDCPGSVHRAAVVDASNIYRIAADGACAVMTGQAHCLPECRTATAQADAKGCDELSTLKSAVWAPI